MLFLPSFVFLLFVESQLFVVQCSEFGTLISLLKVSVTSKHEREKRKESERRMRTKVSLSERESEAEAKEGEPFAFFFASSRAFSSSISFFDFWPPNIQRPKNYSRTTLFYYVQHLMKEKCV
jgi:hypothetical protein